MPSSSSKDEAPQEAQGARAPQASRQGREDTERDRGHERRRHLAPRL